MNEIKNTRVIIKARNEITGDIKSDEMCLEEKKLKKLNKFVLGLNFPQEKKPAKPKTTKNVCANCAHDKFVKVPISPDSLQEYSMSAVSMTNSGMSVRRV